MLTTVDRGRVDETDAGLGERWLSAKCKMVISKLGAEKNHETSQQPLTKKREQSRSEWEQKQVVGIQDLEPDLWRLYAVFSPRSREMDVKGKQKKTRGLLAVGNGWGECIDSADVCHCAGTGRQRDATHLLRLISQRLLQEGTQRAAAGGRLRL